MNNGSAPLFVTRVISELEKLLDQDTYSVTLSRVEKITSSYDSVQIFKISENWGFNIPHDWILNLHEDDGLSAEEIAQNLAEYAEKQKYSVSADSFMDYENVRSSLFVRLSDTERNRQVLSNVPHRDFDGLSMTVHILVPAEGCFASSIVTDDLFAHYGIDEDSLFEEAVENSAKILPVEIRYLSEIIGYDMPSQGNGIVVTNSRKVNGSAAIFYPGVLEEIAQKVNEDFYIFPSSIHEMIIYPLSSLSSDTAACRILHDANRCAVSEEDWLSDILYMYRRADGRMHRVKEIEEYAF